MSKARNRDLTSAPDAPTRTPDPSRTVTGTSQGETPEKAFDRAEEISALEIAGYVGRRLAGKA